tara:strand:- start:469 stop:585 length:117 start_codon:yes stop_codon:yes gene_type:complete
MEAESIRYQMQQMQAQQAQQMQQANYSQQQGNDQTRRW